MFFEILNFLRVRNFFWTYFRIPSIF